MSGSIFELSRALCSPFKFLNLRDKLSSLYPQAQDAFTNVITDPEASTEAAFSCLCSCLELMCEHDPVLKSLKAGQPSATVPDLLDSPAAVEFFRQHCPGLYPELMQIVERHAQSDNLKDHTDLPAANAQIKTLVKLLKFTSEIVPESTADLERSRRGDDKAPAVLKPEASNQSPKTVALDKDQNRAVQTAKKSPELTLITGGPGSGKTEVLVELLLYAQEQSDMFTVPKILVLAFNKLAMKFIKERAVRRGVKVQDDKDKKRYVKPQESSDVQQGPDIEIVNFHSWAYKNIDSSYQVIGSGGRENFVADALLSNPEYKPLRGLKGVTVPYISDEIGWIKHNVVSLSLDEYLSLPRTGRRIRFNEAHKKCMWQLFQAFQRYLDCNGLMEFDDFAPLMLEQIKHADFDYNYVFIDEIQDFSVSELTVVKEMLKNEHHLCFFADYNQKIFTRGSTFSRLKSVFGKNIKSVRLKNNYRFSKQIKAFAEKLLSPEQQGEQDFAIGEPSFDGAKPEFYFCSSFERMTAAAVQVLKSLQQSSQLGSTVIIGKYKYLLEDLMLHINAEAAGIPVVMIKEAAVDLKSTTIYLSLFQSIKGLEFENVLLFGLNDELFPLAFDDEDKVASSNEDYLRSLIYTAATRARRRLFCFSCGNPLRFLDDLDQDTYEIKQFELDDTCVLHKPGERTGLIAAT